MDRKKKRKKEIRLSRSKSAVLRMEHYRTLSKETKKKKKKVLYQSLFVYFEDAKNI